VDGYYDATNRDVSQPRSQRQEQLASNLRKYGRIGWIEQDFDGLIPLANTGCLDFRFGSRRYFIGDGRYQASRNSSPGFAGPVTEDLEQCPAVVDVSALGRRGAAVCLRPSCPVLEISRRTGRDWPDDPIAKGHVVSSVLIYRTPIAELTISSLLDRRYVRTLPAADQKSFQVRIDCKGGVSIWTGKQWSAPAGAIAPDIWTALNLELDYAQGRFAVNIDGQAVVTGTFAPEPHAFDGLAFACTASEAYIDNVKVDWSW
jgi:hypothetical protein